MKRSACSPGGDPAGLVQMQGGSDAPGTRWRHVISQVMEQLCQQGTRSWTGPNWDAGGPGELAKTHSGFGSNLAVLTEITETEVKRGPAVHLC